MVLLLSCHLIDKHNSSKKFYSKNSSIHGIFEPVNCIEKYEQANKHVKCDPIYYTTRGNVTFL